MAKGLLVSSTLKIKCARCGKITPVKDSGKFVLEGDTHYLLLCDPALSILDASPSASEILGFSREELLAKKVAEIDPLLRMGAYDSLLKPSVVHAVDQCVLETLHQAKNGENLKVQVNVRFYKQSNTFYILILCESLRARSFVEDKKVQSIERKITYYTCEFDALLDCDGRYTSASAALLTALDRSPKELIGMTFFQLCLPNERAKLKQTFRRHVSLQTSFRLSHTMLSPIGEKVCFDSYFVYQELTENNFPGFRIMSWLSSS